MECHRSVNQRELNSAGLERAHSWQVAAGLDRSAKLSCSKHKPHCQVASQRTPQPCQIETDKPISQNRTLNFREIKAHNEDHQLVSTELGFEPTAHLCACASESGRQASLSCTSPTPSEDLLLWVSPAESRGSTHHRVLAQGEGPRGGCRSPSFSSGPSSSCLGLCTVVISV